MAVMVSLAAGAAHGQDDATCAQTYLSDLGYDLGTVDGALGPRSANAAQAFLDDTDAGLPPLSDETAALWCRHAETDAEYQAFLDFEYDGFGILPRDVAFAALRADEDIRGRACGGVFRLRSLQTREPIHRISGFNSRMDNAWAVTGALEAERFAAEFGATSAAAFLAGDDDTRTALIEVLARWARADAFLGTDSCVTPDNYLVTTGACGEWRQADGQDLSAMKDATHSTFLMAGLVRSYLALLADHAPAELAADHAAISDWITEGFAARLKRPGDVYFGLNMGWYWPNINLAMAQGRDAQAEDLLRRLQRDMARLVNGDGSITDRTTRGDRALWYHFTSLGEIVMSLEMVRAAGLTVDAAFEARLHDAVGLFLRAVDDHAAIQPWAQRAINATYDGVSQDWDRTGWANGNFAGSWLHVYPYRYPDHPNAIALRELVAPSAGSATSDIDFGFGIGCLYNAAAGRVTTY